MSGVIGPSRYLPGQSYPFKPDGRECDCDECGEEARHAVITEADSFGAEITHLSTVCFLKFQQAHIEKRAELKLCDICHETHEDIQPVRDPDEGLCGRVYEACPACRHTLLTVDPDDIDDGDPLDTQDFQEFADPDDDMNQSDF